MSGTRYYHLNRPPGYGCQPDGWADLEAWQGMGPIPEAPDGWKAHGWAEYENELPFEEIRKWDLLPGGAKAMAEYRILLLEDGDQESAEAMIQDYRGLSLADLRRQAENGSPHAFWVLWMVEAEEREKG